MKKKYCVSVIIPVFNVHPYLIEALDSVRNQTYDNLEIVLIDDGSTDGSEKICDEYAYIDNRIKLIHQHNKGLSAARNVGLEIMTGDAVAFLDPDDKFHPDYINLMLTALQNYNADIVICKAAAKHTLGEMVWDSKEIYSDTPDGLFDRKSSLQLHADGKINDGVWNKLYRKELWEKIRFPEGHEYEDVATTFKVLNCSRKIYCVDKILYLHRIRPGSITTVFSQKHIIDLLLALSDYEEFMQYNIPGIFYPAQLRILRIKILNQLISYYFFLLRNNNDKKVCGFYRERILNLEKEIGEMDISFRLKTACSLIRYCPGFLRIAYPIYTASVSFLINIVFYRSETNYLINIITRGLTRYKNP